jgi:hypothetical protein
LVLAEINFGLDQFYVTNQLKMLVETGITQVKNIWDGSISYIMEQNKYKSVTIVSIAHFGLKDVVQNWIMNLRRYRFNKFVVVCCDQQLFDHLRNQGYGKNVVLAPNEWLELNQTMSYTQWQGNERNTFFEIKVKIWYHLICLEQHFVYSDPDVVWMSSSTLAHLEHQYKYSYADIMLSLDLTNRALFYNTGFFYARATPFVKTLLFRVINEQKINVVDKDDQIALNNVIKAIYFNDSRVESLDPLLYAGGVTYFSLKINQKMNINPLISLTNNFMRDNRNVKAFYLENLSLTNKNSSSKR